MSYKINDIRQIESLANKCGCKNPYFNGFEFKGEKYALGWVTLNENGLKRIKTNNPKVEIQEHFITPSGTHGYCIHYFSTKDTYSMYHKWRSSFYYFNNLDNYLEDAEGLDYKNMSVEEVLSLPVDENATHVKMKLMADGKQIDTPKKAKPLFKDWEVPELLIGWFVFIIFFFAVAIFKDWYIQFILRIVGGWIFGWWRQMKVYGMK